MAKKTKLTKKAEKIILEMIANGHTLSHICEELGFSRMAEWKHRQGDNEYSTALESAMQRRIEIVEESLYAKAVSGDVNAIRFFLMNRSAGRWNVPERTESVEKIVVTIKKDE